MGNLYKQGLRKCCGCKEIFELNSDNFYEWKNPNKPSARFQKYCKKCDRIKIAEYRKTEKGKKQVKKFRKTEADKIAKERKSVLEHNSKGKPRCNCCGEEEIKFLPHDTLV